MTESEIIEGNRLIAEFMGYKLVDAHSPFLGKAWTKENLNDSPLYNILEWNDEKNLWFHSSWQWLMPVLKKIFDYWNDDNWIRTGDVYPTLRLIQKHLSEIDIDGVFYNVIQFIKWYNNQNK